MNQAQLDLLTSEMSNMLQQYNGGMLTIVEVLNKAVDMRTKIGDTSLCGLIDPTTGLEYPTKEECDAMDALNKARDVGEWSRWQGSCQREDDDDGDYEEEGDDDDIGPSDDEIEAMQAREQRESAGLSPKQMDDAMDRAGL